MGVRHEDSFRCDVTRRQSLTYRNRKGRMFFSMTNTVSHEAKGMFNSNILYPLSQTRITVHRMQWY